MKTWHSKMGGLERGACLTQATVLRKHGFMSLTSSGWSLSKATSCSMAFNSWNLKNKFRLKTNNFHNAIPLHVRDYLHRIKTETMMGTSQRFQARWNISILHQWLQPKDLCSPQPEAARPRDPGHQTDEQDHVFYHPLHTTWNDFVLLKLQ